MTAADCWADRDALREGIARVIAPTSYEDRERHLATAVEWEGRDPEHHSEQTRRFMAASYREKADAAIKPALAKADSILKLIEAARHSQQPATSTDEKVES